MNKIFITVILIFISITCDAQNSEKTIKELTVDEIVVTGTLVETQKAELPYTISVVSREQIESSGESAILPLLSKRVPGLFVTERGLTGFGVYKGSAGGMSLRGVGGSPTTGVLIAIDGHPQFMGIMGHHLPDAYMSSDIERVEVIRGAASTIYGSNAMGGVINLITRTEVNDIVRTAASLEYGSYNTQKYMVSNSVKKGKFSSFVSVNHNRTDGHRPYSDFHGTNGYLKLGYAFNEHFKSSIDYSIAKYWALDPGEITLPAVDGSSWIDVLRGMGSVSLSNKFDKTSGIIRAFVNHGEHELYYGWHSKDLFYGVMANQSFIPVSGNVSTVGIEYKRYGGKADNFVNSNIKYPTKYINEAAAYVTTTQDIIKDKLIVNGALRYDYNSYFGDNWVPQGGVSYLFNKSDAIKFSVSKGFRNPTINELYIAPPKNDELMPERVLSYSLSYNSSLFKNRFNYDVTLFYSDGDNMITTLVKGGVPQFFNSGAFKNWGVELATNTEITSWLDLTFNYSFLKMDKPILASPTHHIFGALAYKYKKISASLESSTILDMATQLEGKGKSLVEESYSLLNLRAGYRLFKFMEITVALNNITNVDYQINYNYPMPGVTALGGLKFNF